MTINLRQFKLTALILTSLFLISCKSNANSAESEKDKLETKSIEDINTYTELSAKLLQNVMNKKSTQEIEDKIANVAVETLAEQLKNDIQKKVFWINVYNANIQIILSKNPELYEDRDKFFKEKRVKVAGEMLSFDDIEHGIIRSSKLKLSLGLLKDPFVGKYERTFRTDETDPRIHFALNCGAKSCPLVAIFRVDGFDEKIDAVAKNFLEKVCSYNKEKNQVTVTPLFSWFRGDFGGKNGIRDFLADYNLIPKDSDPEIIFDDYDWTLSLGNYYEQ